MEVPASRSDEARTALRSCARSEVKHVRLIGPQTLLRAHAQDNTRALNRRLNRSLSTVVAAPVLERITNADRAPYSNQISIS